MPSRVEPPQRLHELADLFGVEAGGGLVEAQQAWLADRGARQLHQTLLSGRQLAGQPVAHRGQAESLACCVGRVVRMRADLGARPGVPNRLASTPLRGLFVAAGHQVLAHGEVREYLRRLECAHQAGIAATRHRSATDVGAVRREPRLHRAREIRRRY